MDVVNDNSNIYTLMQSVQLTCWEGSYILFIEQPILPKPSSTSRACYPFTFSFQLISSSGSPIIRHVEPNAGTGLDPLRDLYIQIRFSESVFDVTGNAITQFEHIANLPSAVYLLRTDVPSTEKITPREILTPNNIPIIFSFFLDLDLHMQP